MADLAALRRDPAHTAILTDFDGTLARIVDDPAAAAPLPGAVDVLGALATRFGLVGVVSGRPLSYLRQHLGDGIWLAGLYGLETSDGAVVGNEWRAAVTDAVARARAEFGDAVEDKGLSLTLHFRRRTDLAPAIEAWAAQQAPLVARPAKASVELHPPVDTDKGTVVTRACEGMTAACFLGDDVGDLPAFAALDLLDADTVKIAVRTAETPAELLERADVIVDGPDGALALLQTLLT